MVEFLVTGGAGFIGCNIVRKLVADGRSVRLLDNLSTGRRENLTGLLDKVELQEGDLRDTAAVRRAVEGVRNILHLGALPSVAGSVEDPVTTHDVNINGTLNMLMAARDAGVDRFVFSTSSAVYGDAPTFPKREDMCPMPMSPYALHKLTGEYYCRIFHELYGLKTFSIRYFNVFGPRQNPQSHYAAVVPIFIDLLKNNRPPVIHGDGGQTRDFTFVDDVIAANLACCCAPDSSAGGVYNIASGHRVSVKNLAMMLIRLMGKEGVTPVYESRRAGDVRDSQGDSTEARQKLGWTLTVPFEEGLRRTVEFYTKNRTA